MRTESDPSERSREADLDRLEPLECLQRLERGISLALGALRGPRVPREALRGLEALEAALADLARRLAAGPRAPARIAFLGPTGSGKSKLFNSLLGRVVSPSGFLRPTTCRPVEYTHRALGGHEPTAGAERVLHDDPRWRWALLVDSPDFDSVEPHNRRLARRILVEGDAFVLVLDGLKYADRLVWESLEELESGRRPFVAVLNQGPPEAARADLEARLSRRAPASLAGLVTFPEIAGRDEALAPPGEPALAELAQHLERLAEPGRLAPSSFRHALHHLFGASGQVLSDLRQARDRLDALAGRLEERSGELRSRLDGRDTAPVDPGLREEISRGLSRRLEALDVFRWPRRLLAAPFRPLRPWLRSLRRQPPGERAAAGPPVPPGALVEGLLALAAGARADLTGERDLLGLPGPAGASARAAQARLPPPLDDDTIDSMYRRRLGEYREWSSRRARESAAALTTSQRLRFFLAQALFNSAVLAVEVHTGGALTALELLLDGVLAAGVARACGLALSASEVRAFVAACEAEYRRLLEDLVDEAARPFADLLSRAREDLEVFAGAVAALTALAPEAGEIAAAFACAASLPERAR